MNTTTTTITETWQLGHLIYATTQNHTKLSVYKGVNVCVFTKTSHLCIATLFNTTICLHANTSANKGTNSSVQ